MYKRKAYSMNRSQFSLHTFIRKNYGRGYTLYVSLLIIMVLLQSFLQFLLVVNSGRIIDLSGTHASSSEVFRLFYLLAFSMAGSVCFSILVTLFSGKMKIRLTGNIHNKLASKLCQADYASLEKTDNNELLSRITNDADIVETWLDTFFSLAQLPVKIGIVLIYTFLCSWKLLLFNLLLLILFMYCTTVLSKKLQFYNNAERSIMAETADYIDTSIHANTMIKAFCLEDIFNKKSYKILDENKDAALRIKKRIYTIDTFSTSFGNLTTAFLLGLGAFLIFRGQFSIGTLFTLIFLIDMLGDGTKIITSALPVYRKAEVCAIRIRELLDLPLETDDSLHIYFTDTETDCAYEAESLSFSYGDEAVLRELTFSIKKGEHIAIAGLSGSGKSTLFKLLCGLYRPTSGHLLMNKNDMEYLSVNDIRKQISVVTQESFLFEGTIRSNICIGRPDSSDCEISQACRMAAIDTFIESFPEKYNKRITNANQTLSKGQIQRLNLARGFLNQTPIYLFDEPTSALDVSSASHVHRSIIDGLKGRTVISILHDTDFLPAYDRIMVIKEGKIVGFASHKELLLRCKEYRSLLGVLNSQKNKESIL